VTWDKIAPHGCRAYGFKSKAMPNFVVKQNSGEECLSFKDKTNEKKKE